MLKMLSKNQMQVKQLGEPFGMSKQATSKHLAVLENAGFVDKLKDGRVKRCVLNPEPFENVSEFVKQYHKFWQDQFDALEDYIQENLNKGEGTNDS